MYQWSAISTPTYQALTLMATSKTSPWKTWASTRSSSGSQKWTKSLANGQWNTTERKGWTWRARTRFRASGTKPCGISTPNISWSPRSPFHQRHLSLCPWEKSRKRRLRSVAQPKSSAKSTPSKTKTRERTVLELMLSLLLYLLPSHLLTLKAKILS